MSLFKNILVAVDLTRCNPMTTASLSPIALEVIQRGLAVAKLNSAKLTFLSSFDLSEEVLKHLPEPDRVHLPRSIVEAAQLVLHDLAQQAQQEGVEAVSKLVSGKAWLGITRQVLLDQHDLVVVGTRDLGGLRRALFGNTAMKLFRRCPCPVLVAKIRPKVSPINILAATDFKPAGEEAMRMAIAMARQINARLHILHVVEYPLDRIWSTGLANTREHEYHKRVRADAERIIAAQLKTTGAAALGDQVAIHLADGSGIPDVAIQHFLQVNNIHLLVMGMIGRTGIPGIVMGNTAERLLPEINCSLLAIKPPDFHCPARLEE